jgi:hypothetical protein
MPYSPSYLMEYVVEPDTAFMSNCMSYSQVQFGMKFGCAHWMELLSLRHSKLKHFKDCPFTTVGFEVGFDELLVDASSMDGTALDAVYCGVITLNEDLCCLVGDSGSDDILVADVID